MPVNLELDTATRDVLDFSKLVVTCQEDLDEALQKVPDYRTRPEKIRPDDLHRDCANFTFAVTKSELQPEQFEFLCPIPAPLNAAKLDDIRSMDINWLMLTDLRAENKQDEEFFNRIVQLERVTYKTVIQEQSQLIKAQHRATKSKKVKSKISGKLAVNEDRGDICPECDDEHCGGICKEFLYEAHERLPPADDDDAQVPKPLSESKEGEKKLKKKLKKKIKKKSEAVKDEAAVVAKESDKSVTKKRKAANKTEKSESGKVKEKSKTKAAKSKSIPDMIIVQQEHEVGDAKVQELTKTKVRNKLPATPRRTTKKSSPTRSENIKKSARSDLTDSK